MDLFTEYRSTIATAVLDPRERMERSVRQVVETETRYIPDDVAADVVRSRLATLAKVFVDIIEDRDTRKWPDLLFDFSRDLREAIRREREHGRLKPATNGVDELAGGFHQHRYHGGEIDGLRRLLQPGERAQVVGWLGTKTNQRTVTRAEMRDAARPTTWSNDGTWARQFIPLAQLATLEQEETHAAERAAAPPTYGKNLDYPDGVRPGVGR
jgi:hypothetical protein